MFCPLIQRSLLKYPPTCKKIVHMYNVHYKKKPFVFMKTTWVHYFLQPLLIWLQKVDPKYKYLHRCRSLDWHIFWQVYDYFPPLSWFAHLCIVPFSKAHSALSKREKLSSLCISFKKCIDGEKGDKSWVDVYLVYTIPWCNVKCCQILSEFAFLFFL